MDEMTYLCRSGNEIGVNFYIEATAVSRDYTNRTKSLRVRLYADSEAEGIVSFSLVSASSLTVFGRTFALPSSVKVAKGLNVFFNKTVEGVSDDTYPSNAICELTLGYSSNVYGSVLAQVKAAFPVPRNYYSPALALSGERFALGEPLTFSGSMLDEGYAFSVSVCRSDGFVMIETSVDEASRSIPTYCEWIVEQGNATDMSVIIRIEGEMPGIQEIPVTFYLTEEEGAPYFEVETGYASDNPAVNGLSFGVKNRSFFVINVKNIRCKYGASLVKYGIVVGGVFYPITEYRSEILTDTEPKCFTVTVGDSRGLVRTVKVQTDVREYAPPEFYADVYRSDALGDPASSGSSLSVVPMLTKSFPFDGVNDYSFSLSVYELDGSLVIGKTEVAEGVRYIAVNKLDPYVGYEIHVCCEDAFGGKTERKYLLEALRVEFNIAKNRIGVGKYAERERLLDCAWDIKSEGDVIFTASDGREISLSALFSGADGAVSWKHYNVISSDDLDNAVNMGEDGVEIALVSVLNDGLSYGRGFYAFVKYRIGQSSGCFKL